MKSEAFMICAEQKMVLLSLTCALHFFSGEKEARDTGFKKKKKRGEESKRKGIGRKVTAISQIFYWRNLETQRQE